MIKKIFVTILLVIILFGGTSVAFSYWDNLQESYDASVSVGEGVSLKLDVEAKAPEGSVLVPLGKNYVTNSVDEIILTYNVYLDMNTTNDLNLDVYASNVLLGGSNEYSNLINIEITQESDFVNNSEVLISVSITVTDPQDYQTYQAIVNQEVTFTLTFEATV